MRHHTVIVGGGVIGWSIGYRLAQDGAEVMVLDPNDQFAGTPLPGASRVAAGMLAPVTEAAFGEEALTRFNLASSQAFTRSLEALREATGMDLASGSPGTLFVASDRDELAVINRLFDLQGSLGVEVRKLDADACSDMEPALHPGVSGGLFTPSDKECDPRLLMEVLREAFEKAGGQTLPGTRVSRIELGSGRAAGVVTQDDVLFRADAVVLAAGVWSSGIEGVPPEVGRALRPVKGQALRLGPAPGHAMPVRHIVRGIEVYLVPRSEELVVGATMEEKGFDTSVTARGALDLLRAAERLVPSIGEMEILEMSAGLRPATPDNGPLLGYTSVDGLIAATGHFRNGILQSALTAEAISELILTGRVRPEIEPFSPLRFVR